MFVLGTTAACLGAETSVIQELVICCIYILCAQYERSANPAAVPIACSRNPVAVCMPLHESDTVTANGHVFLYTNMRAVPSMHEQFDSGAGGMCGVSMKTSR